MLGMQEVKHYMDSQNAVVYHLPADELEKRKNFAYNLCASRGYLSYGEVLEILKSKY